MPELRDAVRDYSDDQLVDQILNHKDEYTPEAILVLNEEIAARGISQEQLDSYKEKNKQEIARVRTLDSQDFQRFDHTFSHTDILLAHAVLRDNNVLFYVDNPSSSDTLPTESEALRTFTIHVHKDSAGLAHQLLDEHFSKVDGRYELRHTGAHDRLKSFSFHDIHLDEMQAAEKLETTFTEREREVIIGYGRRLLGEADQVEAAQERVIFYFDNIEPLIEHVNDPQRASYSRTDLLTVLEILQIYCDNPDFPGDMDEAIASLLNVFLT